MINAGIVMLGEKMERLVGFANNPGYSANLNSLAGLAFRFFEERIDSLPPEKAKMPTSTYNHTSRVCMNVQLIYGMMGANLEGNFHVDEEVYAAALCHDFGRLRQLPDGRGPEEWRIFRNEFHHVFSAEDCLDVLMKSGYDSASIKKISAIVYCHGDDIYSLSLPLENKVMKVADKLDKMGATGVQRMLFNRGTRNIPFAEALQDAERTMDKNYVQCLEMCFLVEQVTAQYLRGKEEIFRQGKEKAI